MNEFSNPIAPDQTAFLAANKAELSKTDGGKAIWQNRVKMASEAYQALKGINGGLETLVERSAEDEADEVDVSFPDWPTFRDNFILDWIGSRIVVTDKEADMIFERTAEEALAAIEQAEQNGSDAPVVDTSATTVVQSPTVAPVVEIATKRRGRPPGSAKTAVKKSYYVPVSQRPAKTKTVRKAAAKKKTVAKGSASAKAQSLIEKYAARDWSRKDIIAKLQSQLDMGAAYASTLYQKYS